MKDKLVKILKKIKDFFKSVFSRSKKDDDSVPPDDFYPLF